MRKLRVIFVSNFMNHHQLPISLEMNKIYDYKFIATEPIATEQLNMGYENMNKKYDFILRTYDGSINMDNIINLINNADVVIYGSCPFGIVKQRITQNKLTFKYNERIFKCKVLKMKLNPYVWKQYYWDCARFNKSNHYLLCASAYAAKDFAWFGAFKNKSYKWGYFPEIEDVDIDKIINNRNNGNNLKILWCNRFVKYKHPEMAIFAARILKKNGIKFKINMLGVGPLKEKIQKLIYKYKLSDCVKLIGSVPANKVREHMKKSDICLLTADKGEGWGAVVNESMNYACALLCNKMTGSVPYLIKDGENGYTYRNKKEFTKKLQILCNDSNLRQTFGKNAFSYLKSTWSPEIAIKNFDLLIKSKLNGNCKINILDGPCSKCE